MWLSHRCCRWPVTGDDVDKTGHLFCGELVAEAGGSYCDHHRSVAYEPADPDLEAELREVARLLKAGKLR